MQVYATYLRTIVCASRIADLGSSSTHHEDFCVFICFFTFPFLELCYENVLAAFDELLN